MGECIISRGTSGSGASGGSSSNTLITEIITASTLWNVPVNLKNNSIIVRIFGGGGAGYGNTAYSRGGGGGFMNNAQINLYGVDAVPIYRYRRRFS